MNDRNNTIAGWVLLAGIVALGSSIVAGEIFHAERPEKMGYPIEGVEVEGEGGAAAEQPIAFYHSVHAGQNQIPCAYCHYTADRSVDAGIPSVQLCVGCHVPGSSVPGAVASQASLAFPTAERDTLWNRNANLLVDYWKRGEAIPWVRIHKLPEHARFPHFMHVNAGLECQTCHGPVQEMTKVYQFSSLRMGWCIDCHRG